jgi:hypothetical protein
VKVKTKNLLLFISSYSNPHKDVAAATIAWLAKEIGWNFELYYEAYHSGKHFLPRFSEDHFGSTAVGGFHLERFLFINKLFNVKFAILGNPKLFSSHFLKSIGADIIVETQDLLEFYKNIFSYFSVRFPKELVVVGTRPFLGTSKIPSRDAHPRLFKKIIKKSLDKFRPTQKGVSQNLVNASPYCYPEIYYRNALGVACTTPSSFDFQKIDDFEDVYTLFAPDEIEEDLKNKGFNVKAVDKFQPSDTYWSVTNRITERWLKDSNGVAFCDPVLTSYWLPWLCRHKKLAVYETFMEPVRDQMRDLVLRTEDRILYGRHSSDQDITELSKDDIAFQIMDPGRPLFPIVEESNYRMHKPEKSYYEFEPSDDTLKSYADKRKILCTVLFYCPDIRHAEVLPRILELATLTKMKMGLAITAQWYQLVPEILEMINVPIENGGVFPNVEPLLCSAGIGVGVEANGFLKEITLRKHLKEAKRIISEIAGSESLPKGHYPFLDAIKDYPYSKSVLKRTGNADPPFKTIEELDFEYSISYSSPGKPKVLYKSDSFTAINQTSKHWLPYSPFLVMSNPREIENIELRLTLMRKPGWIIAAFDSPLWLFSYDHWRKANKLLNAASYILRGGPTGKLINTTPHTISRYARILDEKGLL